MTVRASASDDVGTSGRIRAVVHDVADLADAVDDYEQLSNYEQWAASRDPRLDALDVDALDPPDHVSRDRLEALLGASPPSPVQVEETTNTTVDGLNQYIVDNLDISQTDNKDASHLAIGTDGSTTPTTGDTSLSSEHGTRYSVTDTVDNGKDLLTSTFLDSTEANSVNIKEVGLYTAASGGTLLNHSTINEISKDSTKTATIDITLEFRAA